MGRIILASASPRRKELMNQIGMTIIVDPSTIEERISENDPGKVVIELSQQKAEDVASRYLNHDLIIGADTVVSIDGQILGKPKDHQDAVRMVTLLSGNTHQVYTGITLILNGEGSQKKISFSEKTDVHVYPMTEEEIDAYVKTGESADKAGAYGIQGRFASFVKGITGDYTNVVGLPVGRLYHEICVMMEENHD